MGGTKSATAQQQSLLDTGATLLRWTNRTLPLQIMAIVAIILVFMMGHSAITSRATSAGYRAGSVVRLSASCITPGRVSAAPAAACNISTEYLPSDLEQLWMTHVQQWEPAFCNSLQALENTTQVWLKTLEEITKLQDQYTDTSPAQVLAEQGRMDTRVFSRFRTTFECGSAAPTEQVTWIEPLSHGLRHPNALCNRGTDVMDRKYLLLAHQAEVLAARKQGTVQCQNRTCQTMYFDMGATTLQPTPDEAGQGWFYDAYRRNRFTFDRYLLWEAVAQPPDAVFKNVPKKDMHKYQYFNIPVSADSKDESNPVNILKDIAQPGDFVVFKLDIDNYDVEHGILKYLMADPQAFALVDEFFFEEHVHFQEMMVHWGGTVGPGTSLASSYKMFHDLRKRGLRAHSWV